MKIKFLLINAIDVNADIETRYPPLGLGYLCSNLRKHFGDDKIEFKVIDTNVEQEIAAFRPHLIGITCVSQNFNKAIRYAKIAKQNGIPVICGGVHISMLPYSLAKEMDIGVVGEGEETICEILGLFIQRDKFCAEDLEKIKGIVFWNAQGKVTETQKRDLIASLDTLAFPARDLFLIKPNTYMFTSRGCPYRCIFCASSRFWNTVRFFSAEYVVREIAHLVRHYGVNEIDFCDDLFALDIARVKKIRDLLETERLLGKIDFFCAIRANLVTDEIIVLLKEIGVKSIGMGLESGCQETLTYLKQNIDIRDNEKAVKIIKKHGLAVRGSFIIGSPQEERKDILETLAFIKRNRLDGISTYLLTPFPGTPVWDYARTKGLVSDQMDWDKLSVRLEENSDSFILLSEKLGRRELCELFLQFKKYAHRRARIRAAWFLIKRGMRHPFKVPGYLINKIKFWRKS